MFSFLLLWEIVSCRFSPTHCSPIFWKNKEYRIGEKMETNRKGYGTNVSQIPNFLGQNWHQTKIELPSLTTG